MVQTEIPLLTFIFFLLLDEATAGPGYLCSLWLLPLSVTENVLFPFYSITSFLLLINYFLPVMFADTFDLNKLRLLAFQVLGSFQMSWMFS